jgi:plasmid stability protein
MPEKVFVRNIPDDLWRAVKARASLEGITVSEAVQRALSQYLAGGSAPKKSRGFFDGIIGLASGDEPDVSERHDYYLAEEPAPYGTQRKPRRKKK